MINKKYLIPVIALLVAIWIIPQQIFFGIVIGMALLALLMEIPPNDIVNKVKSLVDKFMR
ncbi:MAG: hypothetical protein ACOX6G_03170 [Christensenellales bacterium]|jgi:acyl-CoA thioesterase|nr:hypothetical protein [Clostridiales bacterium]